jgi:hypothetical protein
VKTGCNLAESSKEAYGSKRAVLSIIIIIIIIEQYEFDVLNKILIFLLNF